MKTLTVLGLMLALTGPAWAAEPTPDPSPTVYWKIRGCDHPHRERVAAHRMADIMYSSELLTQTRWRRTWHYAVCVKYRRSSLRLQKYLRQTLVPWRTAHKEVLRQRRQGFGVIPAWGRAKLNSIKACESGGNYRAISPDGSYRGAYQFSFSTWQVVGGSGDPAAASPAEQDWRAWLLLSKHGAGHWPVCGQ